MQGENPFKDYGGIVFGKRFVGRRKEIAKARGRVLGQAFGNLAIQGLPRIGKSSLAWEAFIARDKELEQEDKILMVRINASSLTSEGDLFFKMVVELNDRIEDIESIPDRHHFSAILEKIEAASRRIIWVNCIEKFFRKLLLTGYRVIFVLDEFDAVRHYLDVEGFQLLREITYNPKISVGLVTVSRRSIQEIETEAGSISNLAQTFLNLHLGMFTEEDMQAYWAKFFPPEVQLREEHRSEILRFSGRHPYFLDLFNFHFYTSLVEGHAHPLETTKKAINVAMLGAYETVLSLLQEQGLDTKLMQVIEGPVIDLTNADVQKLEQMDLIHKVTDDPAKDSSTDDAYRGYRTFSSNFDQYLKLRKRDIPIWNLWSETETKLRKIVQNWLEHKYGEQWVEKFQKAYPHKTDYLHRLQAMRDREKRAFPSTYSENLLDFTYPAELFDEFMTSDWNWFSNIFGGQKKDWKLKFDRLARIRNPLAHNKKNILKDFELDGARSSCKEIIEKIDAYL